MENSAFKLMLSDNISLQLEIFSFSKPTPTSTYTILF